MTRRGTWKGIYKLNACPLARKLSPRLVMKCGTLLCSKLHSMETIQVVLDKKLLQATDRAARRTKQNRSAFVRDALRAHLQTLTVRELENRDREGYTEKPQPIADSVPWESEAVWQEK